MTKNRQKHITTLLKQGGKLQAKELCSLYGDFSYKEYSILLSGKKYHLTPQEYLMLEKGI